MRPGWTFFLIVSLALSGGVSGCGKSGGGPAADVRSEPVEGDWIIVRADSEPETLNPITMTTAMARASTFGPNFSLVYETMLQYDPDNNWQFGKPLLAESYPEVSSDHLQYTFTLRDGIKWHDGQPLTVDDFVFSAKAAMCPGVDDAALRSTITDLVNVEALEGRRVRYTMSRPYFMNDFQLGTLYVVPKHIFDPNGVLDRWSMRDLIGGKGKADPGIRKFAGGFNRDPNNRRPVGTGPYRFDGWETGKELRLVRNADYWGKKAYLDRIVFRIMPDVTAALTALKAGDIDLQPRLSSIQYTQQTGGASFDQSFTKAKYNYPSYGYIAWNLQRPFFKDKRVRQALTMLVPRQKIIDSLRFGLGTIAESDFSPDNPDFDPNLKPWPYDPKRAAELLDEAGWTDHDGDGIRDKDGVPFRFEFLGTATNQFTDQLLPVLKEEFRKAGIDMTERRLEFTVQIEHLKDHDFDASSALWAADLITDPYQLWHSSSSQNRGSNFISYNNPEVDKILEQARQEFDREKRKQLYWRLQEILHEDQAYTYLFYPQESAAWAKRFQNVAWLPARPSYDLTQWFVPRVSQKYAVSAPVQ